MRISQLLPIALAAPSLAQGVIAPKTLDIKSACKFFSLYDLLVAC